MERLRYVLLMIFTRGFFRCASEQGGDHENLVSQAAPNRDKAQTISRAQSGFLLENARNFDRAAWNYWSEAQRDNG